MLNFPSWPYGWLSAVVYKWGHHTCNDTMYEPDTCMCERACIVFKVVHCRNYGGNLAGQQLVGNRDPFRFQTSFPAAPWELHEERGEEENWVWGLGEVGGGGQEVIANCIDCFDLSVHPLTTLPQVWLDRTDVSGGGVKGRWSWRGVGVKMTAVHCLSTPAIVWTREDKKKRGEGEGEKRGNCWLLVFESAFCAVPWQKGSIIWLN